MIPLINNQYTCVLMSFNPHKILQRNSKVIAIFTEHNTQGVSPEIEYYSMIDQCFNVVVNETCIAFNIVHI